MNGMTRIGLLRLDAFIEWNSLKDRVSMDGSFKDSTFQGWSSSEKLPTTLLLWFRVIK